jgi:hypothetical protein
MALILYQVYSGHSSIEAYPVSLFKPLALSIIVADH